MIKKQYEAHGFKYYIIHVIDEKGELEHVKYLKMPLTAKLPLDQYVEDNGELVTPHYGIPFKKNDCIRKHYCSEDSYRKCKQLYLRTTQVLGCEE